MFYLTNRLLPPAKALANNDNPTQAPNILVPKVTTYLPTLLRVEGGFWFSSFYNHLLLPKDDKALNILSYQL